MTRSSVARPRVPIALAWRTAAVTLSVGMILLGSPAPRVGAQDEAAGCQPVGAALATTPPEPGAPSPVASPSVTDAPAASPPPPPPAHETVTDSRGDGVAITRSLVGGQPMGIAVDGTDTWGRVFVADRSSDRISVLFGRSPDLAIDCQLVVGARPYSVAVDATTGHVLVTLRGEQRVAIVDGRADDASVLGSVELESAPAWVAIDQTTRRAFVSMPELGQVAILEPVESPPFYALGVTFDSGPFSRWLAVDQERGRLLVSNDGQPESADGDLGNGSVAVFDGRAETPERIGDLIPASVPSGIAFDPVTGDAYVLENGTDQLMTIAFPVSGEPTVSRIDADPFVDEGQNVNPVDLVFLPATRELISTQASRAAASSGGHLSVLRVDQGGRASFDRTIPASEHTTGIALDPGSGRVFVSYLDEGAVAALDEADEPTVAPPPAPIAESMPSPLQVSLAPEDVVRTVGISLLVLLLVGAPTPLFNETFEANLDEIQGGVRRLVPRRASGGRLDRIRGSLRRFTDGPVGLAIYLVAAAVIYAFLTPGFPGSDAVLVLGVAILGLAAATAADILPGQRYVIGRYADRGKIRVALWTLVLAAICVLISRISGMQPGFMYGIIGTFVFVAALGVVDEGRMEARGAVALLALAIVAWFARIPFQPGPGVPASGTDMTINLALVGIFVVAVEGLVFGLIPLSFLPGQKIWAWSRWRWLLLWGAGLALFAHVLVFPVTVAQPNPDPSSLTTTLISVAIYGSVAVGFWLFFRWHNAHEPAEAAVELTADGALALAGPPTAAGSAASEPDVAILAEASPPSETLATAEPAGKSRAPRSRAPRAAAATDPELPETSSE
jgi:DNA-binding beta-propeller fold protein YncE